MMEDADFTTSNGFVRKAADGGKVDLVAACFSRKMSVG